MEEEEEPLVLAGKEPLVLAVKKSINCLLVMEFRRTGTGEDSLG